MQELNGSSKQAKEAFLQDITTRLNSTDAGVKQRAAVQMLEMHTLLSHGTDAASQAKLIAAEQELGFDDTARQAQSFEEFLAQTWLGQPAPPPGTAGYGTVLRSQARTYDGQDTEALSRLTPP
jgi:hypothetical protein